MNRLIRLTLLGYLLIALPYSHLCGEKKKSPQTIPAIQESKACHPKTHVIPITQNKIPFTITQSGKYKLVEDVTYNGSGSAITIATDTVQLSLGAFSITLTDPNATGIFVQDASEFVIDNDSIINTNATQLGFGIHVLNAQKGLITNIFTIAHSQGLFIENSADIRIEDSEFFDATNAGAAVTASINVVFDNCAFINGNNGLIFSGANQDCTVINSRFPDSVFSNLLVQQMNGMIIENCSFTNLTGDPSKLALVQFGDADPAQACNDLIMRNCTIINRPAHDPVLGNTSPEGLGIYQGSGFLVESCVIDIDNTAQPQEDDLSGIHISDPGLGAGTIASNVIVRKCVVQGPATNGLYPDVGTTGVVIEDCIVTGAQKNGIFLAGTSQSTVQNNTVVGNGTNGIFVGEESFSNAINNNVVNSNGANPIVASLLPQGNGIGIASDSSNNTVQHNELFSNIVNGINDLGTGNRIFFNTAYANDSNNYNAATDIIIVSSPGDPSLAAENINA